MEDIWPHYLYSAHYYYTMQRQILQKGSLIFAYILHIMFIEKLKTFLAHFWHILYNIFPYKKVTQNVHISPYIFDTWVMNANYTYFFTIFSE